MTAEFIHFLECFKVGGDSKIGEKNPEETKNPDYHTQTILFGHS